MSAKRLRDLINELGAIGYVYDRTNSKGVEFYIHEDTGCEVRIGSNVDERMVRSVLRLAMQQVGIPTKDNKRNPTAIRERNAAEHERARRELDKLTSDLGHARVTCNSDIARIEEAYLRAERKFRYWDRLMREMATSCV